MAKNSLVIKIFRNLDTALNKTNRELREDGMIEIPRFFIKILGQTALLEANLGLNLYATVDVDAYTNFAWSAKNIFTKILAKYGLIFDELSADIWMPPETRYHHIFKGDHFDGYIAQPEYVLFSKLAKAPVKNKAILIEYLAAGPSQTFIDLCDKYQIDLKEFLDNA